MPATRDIEIVPVTILKKMSRVLLDVKGRKKINLSGLQSEKKKILGFCDNAEKKHSKKARNRKENGLRTCVGLPGFL